MYGYQLPFPVMGGLLHGFTHITNMICFYSEDKAQATTEKLEGKPSTQGRTGGH